MRYAALGLLALLGLVGVVLLIWQVPPALYKYVPDPKDRATAEASTRTGLIAGLAGLAALGGLAITARTYRLTEQGHITDRYTKAIEQLGSDKLDVRLGGVYALERIAVDSQRDHPTIVEVMSAFVREHNDPAHVDSVHSTFLEGDGEPAAERQLYAERLARKPKPLATDVRAALTVLGRLPSLPHGPWADLSDVHFVEADLHGMDLSGFLLMGANLQGASLVRAHLRRALLNLADLRGALLAEANLQGAYVRFALLAEVNLQEADLRGADLRGADLRGADLRRANLRRANLQEASLQEASLREASLREANLQRTDLRGASLAGAHVQGADLRGAVANGKTAWPDGFDWKAARVEMRSEEPTG